MSRFLALTFLFAISLLPALKAEAQRFPMPSRGETLPLDSNDSRCPEDNRCYMVGAWVSGVSRSLQSVLDEVNQDLDEAEQITWAQFEEANPCQIIYRRREGGRVVWRHNGSCDTNPTEERVTYANFCSDGVSCQVWSISGPQVVYRFPSEPRLTPSEEAERMIREVQEAPTVPTVNAPAWIAQRLARMRELLNSDYPPSEDLQAAFYQAVEVALENTPGDGDPPPDPRIAVLEEELRLAREHEEAALERARIAESAAFYRSPWFWLAALCFVGVLILAFSLYRSRNREKKLRDELKETEDELSTAKRRELDKFASRAADNTMEMNATEKLKERNLELEGQLSAKRADDAAETATNRNNAELVSAIHMRWEKLYGKTKLNMDHIGKMFGQLTLLQDIRMMFPDELYGDLSNESMEKLIKDAEESKTLADVKAKLTESEKDLAKVQEALAAANTEKTEAVDRATDMEVNALGLAGLVTELADDIGKVFSGIGDSKGSALTSIKNILSAAFLRVEPTFEQLMETCQVPGMILRQPAMVFQLAGFPPVEEIEGAQTSVAPAPTAAEPGRKKRKKKDTSPFGIQRPERPRTLRPGEGEGLYKGNGTNGAGGHVEPPTADSAEEQPHAADPGTTSISDDASDGSSKQPE